MASSAYQAELEAICPEGWKVVPLTDAVIFQEGPGILAKDFQSSGVPLIRLKGVEGDFVSLEGCNFLAPEKVASKWNHFRLERGDLVISTSASFGRVSEVTEESAGAVPYTGLIRFQPKTKEIDAGFLRAFLGSSAFMQQVEAMASGSVIRHFGPMHLKQMALPLPPLGEQRAIGNMAKLFAERLRNQSQTNESLEAMARTLFKSWFVDFEPVRAKMEGRWQRGQSMPGLPAYLYDLFPARLVESELGEIPEGWRMGSLGEVAVHPRRSVRPDEIRDETPYIALEHMPKRCIALAEWGIASGLESNKYEFRRGEILFGKLRPYFHKVGVAAIDGVCSTDIVVMAPKLPLWFGFVLAHASSDAFVEYTNAGSTGTKMPRTSWTEMARYVVVLPNENAATTFNQHVQAASEAITANIHESKSLAQLRDTLLPKLISGELRVPDIEHILEKASP